MPQRKCLSDLPLPNVSLLQKIGAEFVGTYIMVFCAAATPIVDQKYDGAETLIGKATSAGLAVMAVILSIGHISGAHLNPSVTLAFASLRHFRWSHVPGYIIAQVLASICAAFSLKGVFHPFMSGGVTVPSVSIGQAFALEFIATFILMFVITAVATDTRAVGELAGIAIGGVVLLDILVAGNTTGASMNPVRTIGPAIAAANYKGIWIYMVAPTIGAIAGATTYTAIKLRENKDEPPRQLTKSFPRPEDNFVFPSSSTTASPIWKLPDSLFCLPGDCLTVCSEFNHSNVILCYKENNGLPEILARKAVPQEGGVRE